MERITTELEWLDDTKKSYVLAKISMEWDRVGTYLQYAIFQKFGFLTTDYTLDKVDENGTVTCKVFANEIVPEKIADLNTFLSNIPWIEYEMLES